jgi:uracil-DNA glycosylase family 4
MTSDSLTSLAAEILACRRCPRLVEWREEAAANPPARFAGEEYWARPLPGFGDPKARVMVVGLAPAAHGGNRTGRLFTGDRSGDFLFASLHRTGFANRATSLAINDGLALTDLYLTAVVRCAPPGNRPLPRERAGCLPYLVRELDLLTNVRVVVALGSFAWDGAIRTMRDLGYRTAPRPAFGHLAESRIGPFVLVGSYHPSQQNTFTGRLTPPMLDAVMDRARELADLDRQRAPPRPKKPLGLVWLRLADAPPGGAGAASAGSLVDLDQCLATKPAQDQPDGLVADPWEGSSNILDPEDDRGVMKNVLPYSLLLR